jgi:uncharacterized protein (TIGR02246 family)
MTRHTWTVIGVLAVVAGATAVSLPPLLAQDKPVTGDKKPAQPESAEMAAVRKTADAFARAFNAGDARAVAAFWTKDGEFIDARGETTRGRDAIEKSYVAFFKQHPKAHIEVDIESVRLLGRYTALEEGKLKLTLPGDTQPGISRYSVLHVRQEDGWHMASVREWVPDPQALVSLKDVAWLLGAWTAKGPEGEIHITYKWDEDKAFLRGRYVLSKGDKVLNAGTQIIGKNPGGGLRSWVFDKSGSFGESVWWRDEKRWVIEAVGTLPDGSESTAVNVLIPLNQDAFTWQAIERTVAGSPTLGTPPVKVTRMKADK